MNLDLSADTLPCGIQLADIVEQVADQAPRTPHQDDCPYCRAALTELTLRWAPLRAVADEPVAVPAGLYRAILNRLRHLAANDGYAQWLADEGTTRVGAWVLEQICRIAAGRTAGVAEVRTADVRSDLAESATHPPLTVWLAIVVRLVRPLTVTAAETQRAVREELEHYAGLPVRDVHVELVDIA